MSPPAGTTEVDVFNKKGRPEVNFGALNPSLRSKLLLT